METGDTYFGKQQYRQALERYRTAGEMAPDVPVAYLRQAHALVAMGKYEQAAKLFRRALRVRPDWTDAEFKADSRLPETVLTFGSDAYFDLLKREPALAKFFALGEEVVVVYNGHVYRVKAATN